MLGNLSFEICTGGMGRRRRRRRCIVDNAALLINYSVSRRTQLLKPKMFALLPSQMIILLMEKTC